MIQSQHCIFFSKSIGKNYSKESSNKVRINLEIVRFSCWSSFWQDGSGLGTKGYCEISKVDEVQSSNNVPQIQVKLLMRKCTLDNNNSNKIKYLGKSEILKSYLVIENAFIHFTRNFYYNTVFSRIVLCSTIRNNELGLDTTIRMSLLFECHYYSNFRVRGKIKDMIFY